MISKLLAAEARIFLGDDVFPETERVFVLRSARGEEEEAPNPPPLPVLDLDADFVFLDGLTCRRVVVVVANVGLDNAGGDDADDATRRCCVE